MNLLKSIFISCFLFWLIMFTLYGFTQLVRGTEPLLSWLGLTLAVFSPLVFFARAMLFKPPRTAHHPVEISILSGAGLAITMAMSFRYGEAAGSIHIWAGLTLVGWLLYLRWYSAFGKRDAPALRTGAALPVFTLESMGSHTVSSESFRAKPHLLLFYRGNWCPFCTAQIEELAAAYRRLEDLGVSVVLISPQSLEKNRKLAARLDVPITFLRDRHSAAAKQLGIRQKWGVPMGMQLLGYESDTVLPTVILTDANGTVVFADQTDNYRIRPEPAIFEDLIRSAAVDIGQQ